MSRPAYLKIEAEITKLKSKVKALCYKGSWEEAFIWERKLNNEYHVEYMLYTITGKLEFCMDEMDQMKSESSLFLAGFLHYGGLGGVQLNHRVAYDLFTRSASKGCVLALHYKAHCLYVGQGVVMDEDKALHLFQEASAKNCASASWWAGLILEDRGDYRMAAKLYAHGILRIHSQCSHFLKALLRNYPLECCPFSEWKPTLEVQLTVPNNIHQVMVISATILRTRIGLSRYLVNYIMFWVCTRNCW